MGYYIDTLMCTHLDGYMDVKRKYGEGAIPVSVKEFWTYTVHLAHDVEGNNGKSSHNCIVTSQANPFHSINDPRYLKGGGLHQ